MKAISSGAALLARLASHKGAGPACAPLAQATGIGAKTFASKGDAEPESQVKHEARGAGNAAKFFTDGVSATINTATQKAKEALGMSKPLSQNEDMKPAGGMETLDKAGSKAGIYRDVKHSTEEKADETTGDKPISQLYQNANATAQVNSVPGSTDAFDKVK